MSSFDLPNRRTTIGAALVSKSTPAKTSTNPKAMKETSSGSIPFRTGSILASPTVQISSEMPSQASVFLFACLHRPFHKRFFPRKKTGSSHVRIGTTHTRTNTPVSIQRKYDIEESKPKISNKERVSKPPPSAKI